MIQPKVLWTQHLLFDCHMAISILYPHRKFWRSLYGTNFLEISNSRKTVRMAPILTIFGSNESQRCQLNFEKNLGRRKNFSEGEKFKKQCILSENTGDPPVFSIIPPLGFHLWGLKGFFLVWTVGCCSSPLRVPRRRRLVPPPSWIGSPWRLKNKITFKSFQK